MTWRLAGTVLGLLAAGAATARDRPQMIPTRDVDISYRVVRAGQAVDERIRWLAAGQLERVDPPGSVFMIVDHKTRRIDLVNPPGKSVLQMDAPRRGALEPDSRAAYTKLGETKVAGVSCTEWAAAAAGAAPDHLCVTADGVLLRIEQSGKMLLEATKVVYRRLDPKTFEVPAKFQMTPPPAAAPPPPGIGAIVPE